MEQEKIEPQIKERTRTSIALPIAILGAGFLISASVLMANFLVIAKLDSIQSKLNSSSGGGAAGGAEDVVQISLEGNPPFLGKADAPVTIIEFADFQCPFCKRFHDNTFDRLKTKFIDTGIVKFVFQDYPFLGDESFLAAEAGRCAQDQGKFWEYFDAIYAAQKGENQGDFTEESLTALAKNLQLNDGDFKTCLSTHKHRGEIDSAVRFGADYGVDSTPTFFINGHRYSGALPLYKLEGIINAVQEK